MKRCSEVHKEYDRIANGELQTGRLPEWMHITGKVAWYVFQGPYKGLPDAWAKFGKMLQSKAAEMFSGPPGDLYVCDPVDHKGPEEKNMISILWAPIRE